MKKNLGILGLVNLVVMVTVCSFSYSSEEAVDEWLGNHHGNPCLIGVKKVEEEKLNTNIEPIADTKVTSKDEKNMSK
jgi:hypothetical protein